ncbi:MAG: VWA domain-containing protein [Methylococcaceae bacterium]
MIQFEWPWVLGAIILPWLMRKVLKAAEPQNDAALIVPFIDDFDVIEGSNADLSSGRWTMLLPILAWCLLVLAGARPQWLGEPIEQTVSGRDLMLAVDLSGSMNIEDFVQNDRCVSRLKVTKQVADRFIENRVGDRIGLILFGSNAYLQVPLTFDRKTVRVLLNEAFIGLAGDKTAIGDAIGLALKRLRKQQTQTKVLIVLTDGANTAGEVSPLKAAELAKQAGLKIYTLGMGANEATLRRMHEAGCRVSLSDLDEDTLTKVAQTTGGQYFRAKSTQELEEIYRILNDLEPTEKDKQFFRPQSELYIWPLGVALILGFFIGGLRVTGR